MTTNSSILIYQSHSGRTSAGLKTGSANAAVKQLLSQSLGISIVPKKQRMERCQALKTHVSSPVFSPLLERYASYYQNLVTFSENMSYREKTSSDDSGVHTTRHTTTKYASPSASEDRDGAPNYMLKTMDMEPLDGSNSPEARPATESAEDEFLSSGVLPPEGFVLSGIYTLLRKLGEGGNGKIYLARDNNLDILCAIKIATSSQLSGEENRQRFYNEIKTTAQLRHPNIVSIFYANHLGRYFYYVMEYITGKTCEEMIKERPMEEEQLLPIAISIAKALQYAHQHHVIHRDVKPANVMVDEHGVVKVLDLGLALRRTLHGKKLATTKKIVGTPNYMSPEQINDDRDIDERTDIYSYGATLYHLVTRKLPFYGENIAETLNKVIDFDLPAASPRLLNPKISPQLEELILKCLQKRPERRYQSMDDILLILEAMRR